MDNSGSARARLIEATIRLFTEHPDAEPTTRELYEAAGVTAPTLYHHFGDKDGLIDVVLGEVFARYLVRKHAVPRSGDLIADFAAGLDMHIRFGVENPALYMIMYGPSRSRRIRAVQVAEEELLRELKQLADRGLLRMTPEQAAAATLAAAIGCVMQLLRQAGTADSELSHVMRDTLIETLIGLPAQITGTAAAARQLLAALGAAADPLTPVEEALLRQWLAALASRADAPPGSPRTLSTVQKRKGTHTYR
jgi:AcrR family transcriptional regulator